MLSVVLQLTTAIRVVGAEAGWESIGPMIFAAPGRPYRGSSK
jgi:hypothetical protein